jgi:hypothetical protein
MSPDGWLQIAEHLFGEECRTSKPEIPFESAGLELEVCRPVKVCGVLDQAYRLHLYFSSLSNRLFSGGAILAVKKPHCSSEWQMLHDGSAPSAPTPS